MMGTLERQPTLGVAEMPSADDLRRTCAQFPTGVAVVTATTEGEDHGSTVNAFTSLTLDPPQILICLADTSRTLGAIQRSGAFAVNLLASNQGDIARLFASKDPDKFAQAAHGRGVSAPLLDGTVGAFECELAGAIRNHSHWILVGRVVTVSADTEREPLMFFRGQLSG